MKIIRKCSIVLVFTLLLVLLAAPAFASTYDKCADALSDLGLFKGTANGYELDRPATRAEAAVMLVRLLGQEEKAIAANYNHPFNDVPEWADAAVGYMYENKLTNGISKNTFGSQDLCDAQMFYTFALRALGYSEAEGDFKYRDVDIYAQFYGLSPVYNYYYYYWDFYRDDMVAIAYSALAAPIKGEDNNLLYKLSTSGAVDYNKAKPYLDMFEVFSNCLNENIAPANINSFSGKYSLSMTSSSDDLFASYVMSGSMKFKLNKADLANSSFYFNADTKTDMFGEKETVNYESTYVDKILYTNEDGLKYYSSYADYYPEKISYDDLYAEISELFEMAYEIEIEQQSGALVAQSVLICYLSDARKISNGYEISFDLDSYSDFFNTGEADLMQLSPLTCTLRFKNGNINAIKCTFSAAYLGEPKGEMELLITIDNLLWNTPVNITKPSDYKNYMSEEELIAYYEQQYLEWLAEIEKDAEFQTWLDDYPELREELEAYKELMGY